MTEIPLLRRLSRSAWLWMAVAAAVALIPFLPGFVGERVFYIRDLSSFFWGRYLWLRRGWLAGEWPLWDPYAGGGQAAYSDGLHQMFFPPAVLARLIGGEVLGFNLWVALPFPLAAIGAWAFLSRRTSAAAAALGAIAFAACGPVVATGDFPNLSWAVAALPWVLWATDRLIAEQTPRNLAVLGLSVGLQCLAGEPVTLFTTLVLASGYALAVGQPEGDHTFARGVRYAIFTGLGAALGIALSAIQLIPMASAAIGAGRSETITADAWSLRPTALLETIWLHLFGNYFTVQSLKEIPWMQLMYTDREPLLFSIYFGVPLLALAAFGLAGTAQRRWRLFWVSAGLVSVVAAFGSYTPIYPILRDHVPPFGFFRFPVKYIMAAAMAVAAGAASGCDALASELPDRFDPRDSWRMARARLLSIGFAGIVAAAVAAFAAACLLVPAKVAAPLEAFAGRLGDQSGTAADYILRTVPRGAPALIGVSVVTAALLALCTSRRRTMSAAYKWVLCGVVVTDLVVRAWGVNPAFDVAHVAEPAWLSYTSAHPDARFYVGGKFAGTLFAMDRDSSRGFLNAPGLTGSASRATLNIQAAAYSSGWHAREMLSYDLPVLWPHAFAQMSKWFGESDSEPRDRLLDRTGVRYRVLPQRRAGGRQPVMPIPQFYESFLFDWGEDVAARASVVSDARLVRDLDTQIKALFQDDWDSRSVALIDRELPLVGEPGTPTEPFARFVEDRSNHAAIEAGAGPGGGYLVVLDSYSDDWHATLDGRPAKMGRANGLFRAVRLPEGVHRVEFSYRPRPLVWGSMVTMATLAIIAALFAVSGRRRPVARERTSLPQKVRRPA